MTKKLKLQVLLKKMLKFVLFRNYTVTYCQTLEEVPWFLRLKKPKKRQKCSKKLESKFYQKIAKICDIKKLQNYSMADKNLSVTYYRTL